ncbi:MAG: carboxypeptidase regulatory-like domain-containing protein, partial [Aureliella sp.]
MRTPKFASHFICVAVITLTSCGARLIAQENGSSSLFERVKSLPLTPAATDARNVEFHGIVREPDFTEAQAVVICISAEPSKTTILGRTTTDSGGRFSFSLSPSEKQSKFLKVFAIDAEDRLGWCSGFSHSTPVASLPVVLHENSGRIAGKLIATNGEPVDGIPVRVWALFEPFENASGCCVDFEPFQFKTVSDADGNFAIGGLPASMHAVIRIEAEDFDNQLPVIATSAETPQKQQGWIPSAIIFSEFAEIKLFPKHELLGTVVDSQGNPIAGVRLCGQSNSDAEAVSDAEGRFTMRRLNPTALGPSVPKGYSEIIEVIPPAGSRFTSTYFQLNRQQFIKDTIKPIVLEGAWVNGRVLSATTKQPLPGIQVRDKLQRALQTSDAEGRFRFNLGSGPQDIQFSPNWMSETEATQFLADPKSRAVRLIDVLDGESVDMGTIVLDINTEAVKPVTVKVVLADGSPVANCRLEFFKTDSTNPGGGSRRYQSSLVQDATFVEHALTNDHGLAIIKPATGWGEVSNERDRPLPPNLPPGIAQVLSANTLAASFPAESPRHFGRLEIPKSIPDGVVELKLEEGAYLHGNVTLNGSPLEGIGVSATASGSAPILGSAMLTAETDAQGNYAIFAPRSDGYSLNSIKDFPSLNWSLGLGGKLAQAVGAPLEFEFPQIDLLAGSRN